MTRRKMKTRRRRQRRRVYHSRLAHHQRTRASPKKEESSDDKETSDIDDEAIALFVRKFSKFIKKKGYGARKRRDHNEEYMRRCYMCRSLDHVVAECPYNSDNDEDEKKRHKKEKKEKKEKNEKKMTFQKKKGEGYVVTWDSDGSSDSDDSSDDGKKSIKKALASIVINNKPSIFDTPSTCLMAKPTKIKYDVSDDDYESDDCRSDDEEDTSRRSSWTCVSKCTLALI
jgi:hypothetical protein